MNGKENVEKRVRKILDVDGIDENAVEKAVKIALETFKRAPFLARRIKMVSFYSYLFAVNETGGEMRVIDMVKRGWISIGASAVPRSMTAVVPEICPREKIKKMSKAYPIPDNVRDRAIRIVESYEAAAVRAVSFPTAFAVAALARAGLDKNIVSKITADANQLEHVVRRFKNSIYRIVEKDLTVAVRSKTINEELVEELIDDITRKLRLDERVAEEAKEVFAKIKMPGKMFGPKTYAAAAVMHVVAVHGLMTTSAVANAANTTIAGMMKVITRAVELGLIEHPAAIAVKNRIKGLVEMHCSNADAERVEKKAVRIFNEIVSRGWRPHLKYGGGLSQPGAIFIAACRAVNAKFAGIPKSLLERFKQSGKKMGLW